MKNKIKGYYAWYFAAVIFYVTAVVKCIGGGEFDTASFCLGTVMLCNGCAEAKQEKKKENET